MNYAVLDNGYRPIVMQRLIDCLIVDEFDN